MLKVIRKELAEIEREGNDRNLGESKLSKIQSLKAECLKWRTRMCQLARQHSGVKNLTLKDHNTKYFIAISSLNRKQNWISKVKISGITLQETNEIRYGARHYFQQNY